MQFLRNIFVLCIIALLMSFAASIDEVVSAIKVGDATRMSKYFDNMVEITINDRTRSYGKTQAEMVVRDFFASKGVKSFKVVHRGDSNDSEYCVGSLATVNGEFRTTIFMKFRGDRKVIQELRFEETLR